MLRCARFARGGSAINIVLDTLDFEESVKRWISVFYADIETTVFNNGFATKWLKPSRGVRQGCPLYPLYLFVLSADILAARIRQNNLIEGINLFVNCEILHLFL